MSKITFRADEDLVERIEAVDASKSEVMREALRAYLDGEARTEREQNDGVGAGGESGRRGGREPPSHESAGHAAGGRGASLDAALADRVDALVAERLAAREARTNDRAQDVNVNVTLETDAPVGATTADATATGSPVPSDEASDAELSGVRRDAGRGESACGQCGETLDDEHVYCPNCGEKAAHRLFCDCGDEIRSDWAFCPSCGRRTPSADVLDQP